MMIRMGVSVYRAEMGYIHLCPDTLEVMLEMMRLSDFAARGWR